MIALEDVILKVSFVVGSLNKVVLIGNVGRDPEIRSTQDGKEIASFSLATSETWKDKMSGEKKEKVEWHKVVVFSPNLSLIVKNYIKKGSKIYIEGSLQTRKWSDSNGVEKYSTEVILQAYNATLILLDGKGSQNEEHFSNNKESNPIKTSYQSMQLEDDEMPF